MLMCARSANITRARVLALTASVIIVYNVAIALLLLLLLPVKITFRRAD